ncbi:MAG: metallophosphoesterase [Polyangiaceae bacterium]|jgi:predicted MPP superfamily phosphohydrolase
MFWLFSLLLSLAAMGVLFLWSTRNFVALKRRKRTVAAVLVAMVVGQLVTRWTVVLWHFGNTAQTALVVLVMTLGIAAIPIAVIHVVGWLVERVTKKRDPGPPSVEAAMTRRQVVEAAGGTAVIAATGATLGWGVVRGRHDYELVEVPVRIAGLPRALDGYVIAQVSDLHAGTYVDERDFDAGFERVRAAKPDLVVVTGDIVDFDPAYLPMVSRKLAELAPRDGIYACLGNHDYYAGWARVLASLRGAGIHPLVNEGTVVRPRDDGGFALLGVDERWAGRYDRPGPQLDDAIAMVPAGLPRVLLSHQPVTVDRWPGKVALQLSGHTHGGQINPGFRPADLFMSYVAGLYRVGGTTLYVNRGFGTVGPPSRVDARPEITRIVLVSA